MDKKYQVLKIMQVVKSTKDNSLIFRDNHGKIYFIDKKYNSGYKGISEGQKILVWVVKELDKVGYVRLTIDNVYIEEFIENIPNLHPDFFLKFYTGSTELTYLFSHYSNNNLKSCLTDNVVTLHNVERVELNYEKMGIHTELDEHRLELAIFANELVHVNRRLQQGV